MGWTHLTLAVWKSAWPVVPIGIFGAGGEEMRRIDFG